MTLADAPIPHYPDVGCSLSPSCLACHLPICRYDRPPRLNAAERAQAALMLRTEGQFVGDGRRAGGRQRDHRATTRATGCGGRPRARAERLTPAAAPGRGGRGARAQTMGSGAVSFGNDAFHNCGIFAAETTYPNRSLDNSRIHLPIARASLLAELGLHAAGPRVVAQRPPLLRGESSERAERVGWDGRCRMFGAERVSKWRLKRFRGIEQTHARPRRCCRRSRRRWRFLT